MRSSRNLQLFAVAIVCALTMAACGSSSAETEVRQKNGALSAKCKKAKKTSSYYKKNCKSITTTTTTTTILNTDGQDENNESLANHSSNNQPNTDDQNANDAETEAQPSNSQQSSSQASGNKSASTQPTTAKPIVTQSTSTQSTIGQSSASPTGDCKLTSTSKSSNTAVTDGAITYAPQNFATVLSKTYSGVPAVATTLLHTGRYMLSDSASNYLTMETAKTSGAYSVTSSAISGTATNNDYMLRLVQIISDSSTATNYRLNSHLHPNYSLDVDASNNLKFTNNWGVTNTAGVPSVASGIGYVTFAYDSSSKFLRAKQRYSLSTTDFGHSLDASFSQAGYYVRVSGGSYSLVNSSSSATQVTFKKSPINFDMPFDFNPNKSNGSTNKAMPYSASFNKAYMSAAYFSRTLSGIAPAYRGQISADCKNVIMGYNATTVAAQDAMLDTISASATANKFTLRYPISTYKVFRDAALRYKLMSDGVVDGVLGAPIAPLVWFTNGKDSSGVYHPFMMIAAFSVPDTPAYLADIVKPPGGGDSSVTKCNNGLGSVTGYPNQCVTRSLAAQNFIWRVPLKDYGLTSKLCDNTMNKSYYSDFVVGTAATYCSNTGPTTIENYASIADSGVMIDGTSMYPVLNNVLITSQEEPSLNQHGCHVGQGMGYHCHSDGFSVMNNNMSLYNIDDYASQPKNHPPLIGFGFDGVALYGRYSTEYPSMVGYTTSATKPSSTATPSGNDLDAYGGHTHLIDGKMVYHYHSRPYQAVTKVSGASYYVHSLITGAWRGKINAIPDFWEGTKPNTAGRTASLTD